MADTLEEAQRICNADADCGGVAQWHTGSTWYTLCGKAGFGLGYYGTTQTTWERDSTTRVNDLFGLWVNDMNECGYVRGDWVEANAVGPYGPKICNPFTKDSGAKSVCHCKTNSSDTDRRLLSDANQNQNQNADALHFEDRIILHDPFEDKLSYIEYSARRHAHVVILDDAKDSYELFFSCRDVPGKANFSTVTLIATNSTPSTTVKVATTVGSILISRACPFYTRGGTYGSLRAKVTSVVRLAKTLFEVSVEDAPVRDCFEHSRLEFFQGQPHKMLKARQHRHKSRQRADDGSVDLSFPTKFLSDDGIRDFVAKSRRRHLQQLGVGKSEPPSSDKRIRRRELLWGCEVSNVVVSSLCTATDEVDNGTCAIVATKLSEDMLIAGQRYKMSWERGGAGQAATFEVDMWEYDTIDSDNFCNKVGTTTVEQEIEYEFPNGGNLNCASTSMNPAFYFRVESSDGCEGSSKSFYQWSEVCRFDQPNVVMHDCDKTNQSYVDCYMNSVAFNEEPYYYYDDKPEEASDGRMKLRPGASFTFTWMPRYFVADPNDVATITLVEDDLLSDDVCYTVGSIESNAGMYSFTLSPVTSGPCSKDFVEGTREFFFLIKSNLGCSARWPTKGSFEFLEIGSNFTVDHSRSTFGNAMLSNFTYGKKSDRIMVACEDCGLTGTGNSHIYLESSRLNPVAESWIFSDLDLEAQLNLYAQANLRYSTTTNSFFRLPCEAVLGCFTINFGGIDMGMGFKVGVDIDTRVAFNAKAELHVQRRLSAKGTIFIHTVGTSINDRNMSGFTIKEVPFVSRREDVTPRNKLEGSPVLTKMIFFSHSVPNIIGLLMLEMVGLKCTGQRHRSKWSFAPTSVWVCSQNKMRRSTGAEPLI